MPELDSRTAIDTALHRRESWRFPVTLFRSKTSGQVLYLEAGKDFIDTLLSFLVLPLGTIIHMLSTGVPQEKLQNMAISSIFESVENLDTALLHIDKSAILAQPRPAANNPRGLSKTSTSTGLLDLCQDAADTKRPPPPKEKKSLPDQFHKCDNCTGLSSTEWARCYPCWPENAPNYSHLFSDGPYYLSAGDVQRQDDLVAELNQEPEEEYNQATGPGFVKENISFMVTDHLEVTASTASEIMSVLRAMKVNYITDVKWKKMNVTITQVLQLLRCALTSTSCLNDVFGTEETSQIPGETSSSEMQEAAAKVRAFQIPLDSS